MVHTENLSFYLSLYLIVHPVYLSIYLPIYLLIQWYTLYSIYLCSMTLQNAWLPGFLWLINIQRFYRKGLKIYQKSMVVGFGIAHRISKIVQHWHSVEMAYLRYMPPIPCFLGPRRKWNTFENLLLHFSLCYGLTNGFCIVSEADRICMVAYRVFQARGKVKGGGALIHALSCCE